VPTFEAEPGFIRDFLGLRPQQRAAFLGARDAFLDDLRAGGRFRAGLRIKHVRGKPGIWEMTWAPDGRATFRYGAEQVPGHTHIVWRRVGTHDIFRNP
jgi:hypothetical protein